MSESRLLAAGALLWKDPRRSRIAVVHRHRYDDYCLPKGKLEEDETFAAAALREVKEETGYELRMEEFAGEVYYRADGIPKSVLFWHMLAVSPEAVQAADPEEVAEVLWLSIEDALATMSHETEKELLRNSSRSGADFGD